MTSYYNRSNKTAQNEIWSTMSESWGRGHPMQTAPDISILPLIRKLDVINPSSSTVHQYNLSPALVRDKDSRQIIWQIQSSLFFHFKRTLKTLAFIFSDQVHFVWNDKHLNGESESSRPKLQSSLAKQPSWRVQNKVSLPWHHSNWFQFHNLIFPWSNQS